MKTFIFAALAALCLAMPGPALAFDTPVQNPAQRQVLGVMGEAFQPLADRFDCKAFAWANFLDPEQRIAHLEYIPEGDDVENWTRMVTVSVYALTGQPEHDHHLIANIARALQAGYEVEGKLLDVRHYTNQNKEPGIFLEYEIGEGTQREHNAGLFMRTGPKAAAFIQIQSRLKPLAKADAEKLLHLVEPSREKEADKKAPAPEAEKTAP